MKRIRFVVCTVTAMIISCLFASAAGLIVVVKDGKAERRDENGIYQGRVGNSGALSAVTDGERIVVLYDSGKVCRYDSKGVYQGVVGEADATGIQINADQIIITYQKGQTKRYDAKTGLYKGML